MDDLNAARTLFPRTHRLHADHLRRVVGYGAMVATVPYLTLKLIWISGGHLGMADPAFFQNATYFYANIATLAMDVIAILLALVFTTRWGLRVPALLLLGPAWLATGFLLPIVVLLPCVAATGTWPANHDDPLQPWVYLLVYGGFAAQGALLLTAFALYVRARWSKVFSRVSAARGEPPARKRGALLITASVAAGLVGTAHFLWASGATIGMSAAFAAQQSGINRLTHGVYGSFALGAAISVPLLIVRVRHQQLSWAAFALGWAGTGAMCAWGSWLLLTVGTIAPAAPGYRLVLLIQVLAAIALAFVAVRVLVTHQPRVPMEEP